MKEIAALCAVSGEPYKAIAQVAKRSFEHFHPDIEFLMPEINGYGSVQEIAWNRMVKTRQLLDEYKKIIFLGADVIICDRMTEMIEDEWNDACCTLDYAYVPKTLAVEIPPGYFINSDVTCYANKRMVEDIIGDMKIFASEYYEQGALNRVVHGYKRYNINFIEWDGIKKEYKCYYNDRSKKEFCAHDYSHSMHKAVIKNNLMTMEDIPVRVIHVCNSLFSSKDLLKQYREYFKNNFTEQGWQFLNEVSEGELAKI